MIDIRLYKGEENGIVIEKDSEGSMFSSQYARAKDVISEMVSASKEALKDAPSDSSVSMTPNIVAFCGDRGEGKTSCMESVVLQLRDNDNCSIDFLDTIDPAFFDNDHNVVEIMLGMLYKEFVKYRELEKEKYSKEGINEHQEKYQEAIDHQKGVSRVFQYARSALRYMYEENEQKYDALEELSNMKAGISLHEKVEELMRTYLKWRKKDALVIRVDDTDLNIKGAYEMLEKIRIFLNNPYCIILMSTKLEQLQKVVADGLSASVRSTAGFPLQTMALRYIIKVIPIGRQIHMPKVYDICDLPLTIYKKRGDTEGEKFPSVKDAVVRMIFTKTRFLFYNSHGSVSAIIPNNLRSFRHLVGMLYAMPYFDSREESQDNMSQFIHYFYQTWTEQLNEENRSFAMMLIGVQDIISLNKIVIAELQKYLTEEQKEQVNRQDILNSNVANYNVSVGDVFYLLDVMDKTNTDSQLLMLTFFIRSFYSIKLYEAYDKMTANIDHPRQMGEDDGVGEIYRTDQLFKNTSVMHRLVNGSMFTYLPGELLPTMSNGGQARDFKVVDGERVNKLFASVRNALVHGKDYKNEKSEDLFRKEFRMAEFLALTIRRSVTTDQLDTFYKRDRDESMPYHMMPFTQYSTYYVFDALMPFVTLMDVAAAYGRISQIPGGEMYKYALNNEWSLLRKMMDAVREKELEEGIWPKDRLVESYAKEDYIFPKHRMASNISIRNGEVLSAVFEGIKSRRYKTFMNSKNTTVLGTFYRDCYNSEMKTYNRNATKKAYTIRFSCLKAIGDWLMNLREEELNEFLVLPDRKAKRSAARKGNSNKRQQERNIKWAQDRFAKLNLDSTRYYTRDDVRNMMSNSYPKDLANIPETEWTKTFKSNRPMKVDTIYERLALFKKLLNEELKSEPLF